MGNSALAITEEHRELADAAQRQLSRFNSRVAARATLEDGKSHPADLWSASVAVGWPGLAIAEEYGGSGFGLSELAIVLEAQGRELCPGPFLPSVTAAVVIDRCGGSTLRQRWLPGVADGSVVGAVGLSGDVTVGSDLVATGASPAALGAPDAGVLVLLAGDDVVIVDAGADGVTVTAATALDTTRSIGEVTLRDVTVPEDHVLRGAARRARTVFRILAAAEAAGGAWAASTWPSTTPRCASSSAAPSARSRPSSTMPRTCWSTPSRPPRRRGMPPGPTTWTTPGSPAPSRLRMRSGAQVCNAQNNIQLHGGIGFTWEHDAHLYLRRALTLAAIMADGADPLVDVVDGPTHRAGPRRVVRPARGGRAVPGGRPRRRRHLEVPDRAEQRRDFLVDSGYLVPHWPKPWGRAASAAEQLVIEEEFDGRRAGPDMGITGWVMLTIAQAGNRRAARTLGRPDLRGKVRWCQLFSEPGAGSDAAAIATRGKRVDGGWRVTGQKVWTSRAHECEWGLATVRTDSRGPSTPASR